MKNTKMLFILVISCAALASTLITAKAGCLSKSYQLKQKFDPKEYHEVVCNCPCDYWAMRGLNSDAQSKCLECGHAHNPGPNPYVPQANMALLGKPTREANPLLGVHKMILDYKNRK